MANRRGLRPALERIQAQPQVPTTAQQRAEFAMTEGDTRATWSDRTDAAS
jgi:hypothetical protein